jgi:hypothetical protein
VKSACYTTAYLLTWHVPWWCNACRLSNAAPADGGASPVYLDQVVLQYWFHGPQQAAEAAAAASDSSTTSSIAAHADASQLSLGCTDAGAPLSEWLGHSPNCHPTGLHPFAWRVVYFQHCCRRHHCVSCKATLHKFAAHFCCVGW